MKTISEHKHKIALIAAVVVLALLVLSVVVYYGGFTKAKRALINNERVITEAPLPRTFSETSTTEGRFVASSGEDISLTSGERVVIEDGVTLKESYVIAEQEARTWASDAKLVYIKSLGTVTTEGVSSGWEVVFGSDVQKSGYALAVIGGVVSEKKEVVSAAVGYELPQDWYDAVEAIRSIQTLPQFEQATISGLSFYYNEDGKRWGYAISSSNGTVSIPVR